MEVGKLNVSLRPQTGKGQSRGLRRTGVVPGVCYGAGLTEPLHIMVNPKHIKAALDPAKGRNTVIEVEVTDGGKVTRNVTAMLKDYQVDKIRREVTHVDLIAIDRDQPVDVAVPLEITGKSPGATLEGGQLHLVRYDIPIRCKPADIPNKFVLDVTPLHIGDVLHVTDLQVPAGVTVRLPGEFGLVTCTAPQVEKEPEVAAPVEGAAPAEGAAAAAPGAAGGAAPAAGAKGAPAAGGKPAAGGDAKKPEGKKDAK